MRALGVATLVACSAGWLGCTSSGGGGGNPDAAALGDGSSMKGGSVGQGQGGGPGQGGSLFPGQGGAPGQGGTILPGQGGSPAGGASGGVSTGIEGTRRLDMLSATDTEKLCAATKSFVKDTPALATNLCRLVAVVVTELGEPMTDTEAQMLCQMGFTDCTGSIVEGGSCGEVPPGCTATVSQLEACWSATPAFVTSVTASIPACGVLTLKDLQNLGNVQPPPQPAACVTLDNLGCADLDLTGNE
jgi:hypothetical protein